MRWAPPTVDVGAVGEMLGVQRSGASITIESAPGAPVAHISLAMLATTRAQEPEIGYPQPSAPTTALRPPPSTNHKGVVAVLR
jgi:hypothetical protein